MKTLRRIGSVACGVAVLACIIACGNIQQASARIKRQNDLKKLGIAAHNYHDANQTFPPDQQSFVQFAQKIDPEAVAVIQQTGPGGSITFHYGPWRLGKDFEPQGSSGTVLASDNTDWSGNRIALFADGSVRLMNAAELAAAPRPKKSEK